MADNSFQLKKWQTIFKKLDADENGKLTSDDVIVICERGAQRAGVEVTDEIRKPWIAMFEAMCGGGREMTFEQLKTTLQLIDKTDDKFETMAALSVPMFKAFDVNNDNRLSVTEYKAAIMPLNVSEPDCEYAFNIIDEDKDGYLSHQEFAVARAHYYFDKEDTKYKHFYGKFPEE